MYIVEANSRERETEAIRHLADSPLKDELLGVFGFDALNFVIVEAQKPKLIPGVVGDIDILAGNLDFKDWADYRNALAEMEAKHPEYPEVLKTQLAGKIVSEADGLRWPPEPVFVAGVEVKCAYFTDRLKAGKSSVEKVSGIRNQIDWLEKIGLDKFGLLDVIGNEPSYQEDGGYLGAMDRASRSRDAMRTILADRLPATSAAAQFVWSVGSVGGGDEGVRGTGRPLMLRPPVKNPRLAANDREALAHRAVMLQKIPELLAHLPCPRYFPVVFMDCRKCKLIHYLEDPACFWNRRAA
jgi:hypothetical protein